MEELGCGTLKSRIQQLATQEDAEAPMARLANALGTLVGKF
jgi:hypothetical protein